jgi:hypothetical protein
MTRFRQFAEVCFDNSIPAGNLCVSFKESKARVQGLARPSIGACIPRIAVKFRPRNVDQRHCSLFESVCDGGANSSSRSNDKNSTNKQVTNTSNTDRLYFLPFPMLFLTWSRLLGMTNSPSALTSSESSPKPQSNISRSTALAPKCLL